MWRTRKCTYYALCPYSHQLVLETAEGQSNDRFVHPSPALFSCTQPKPPSAPSRPPLTHISHPTHIPASIDLIYHLTRVSHIRLQLREALPDRHGLPHRLVAIFAYKLPRQLGPGRVVEPLGRRGHVVRVLGAVRFCAAAGDFCEERGMLAVRAKRGVDVLVLEEVANKILAHLDS